MNSLLANGAAMTRTIAGESMNCPFCSSPESAHVNDHGTEVVAYECGTLGQYRSKDCRIAAAVALLRRHNQPGVVTSTQQLAQRALAELES